MYLEYTQSKSINSLRDLARSLIIESVDNPEIFETPELTFI